MSFIQLCNGEKHTFLESFVPDIRAIAFSLSHINRYTGHAGQYSVAHHSILVANELPDNLKLAGLLHDATESYINDLSKPLKEILPEYCRIEKHYADTISEYFDVDLDHELIKKADLRMLVTEGKSFGFDLIPKYYPDIAPYEIKIESESPERIYRLFLDKFFEYGGSIPEISV